MWYPVVSANPITNYLLEAVLDKAGTDETTKTEILTTKTAVDEFFSGNIFYEPIFTKDAVIFHYNPVWGKQDEIIFNDKKI